MPYAHLRGNGWTMEGAPTAARTVELKEVHALAALAHTRRDRPIPVYFIGVGEGIDDLQAFSAEEFAAALVD
jgi:hypothetical protein